MKAVRLLADGRLRVTDIGDRTVHAVVLGDSGNWLCGYRPGGWWCECPAHGRCSHLVALRLVVDPPLQLAAFS